MTDVPTREELHRRIKSLEREVIEARRFQEEKGTRIEALWSAVKHVRQLIENEKDSQKLIQSLCNGLVSALGYRHVWIVRTDPSKKILSAAQSGLNGRFMTFLERLEREELPPCCKMRLEQPDAVFIASDESLCAGCPLCDVDKGERPLTVALKHGETFYGYLNACMLRKVPLHKEEESLLGLIADDIAYALYNLEMKAKQKAFRDSLSLQLDNMKHIMNALTDGAYIINSQYAIQFANKATLNDFGKVGGRPCYTYFHERESACPWCKMQDIQNGKTVRSQRHSPKTGKDYDLIDIPMQNDDGSINKLAMSRDITAMKRVERSLRESEAFLEKSQEMAHIGSWKLDFRNYVFKWSDELFRILGLDPRSADASYRTFIATVHPDDRDRVAQSYRKMIEDHHPFEDTYRLLRPDGTVRIVRTSSEETFDELGNIVLSNGIVHDITAQAKAEEMLENTAALINRSPIVIFQWDNTPGWPVRLVSENVQDLFGYTAQEFTSGRIAYTSLIHKDDIERVTEEVVRHSEQKGGKTFTHEPYRIIARDGTEKYIADLTTIQRNSRGEITHYEGILWDITNLVRKELQIVRSLKEKSTLLSEIHHRVKNNMQIITSLLRLQSEKIADSRHAAMFKDAEDRIKAMALIHERLYQSEDFMDVDFRGYVQSLVDSLLRSYTAVRGRIQLKITIEDVALGMDKAIPCGLLINEAISNALKHAFPEQTGEIRIDFRPVEGDLFELTINDNGIGLSEEIDFDAADSMGLTLIKLLGVDQLDGSIELNRQEGTTIRVRFRK